MGRATGTARANKMTQEVVWRPSSLPDVCTHKFYISINQTGEGRHAEAMGEGRVLVVVYDGERGR